MFPLESINQSGLTTYQSFNVIAPSCWLIISKGHCFICRTHTQIWGRYTSYLVSMMLLPRCEYIDILSLLMKHQITIGLVAMLSGHHRLLLWVWIFSVATWVFQKIPNNHRNFSWNYRPCSLHNIIMMSSMQYYYDQISLDK